MDAGHTDDLKHIMLVSSTRVNIAWESLAGFIVLARDMARGCSDECIRGQYQIALFDDKLRIFEVLVRSEGCLG